jgi:hypothetical protein
MVWSIVPSKWWLIIIIIVKRMTYTNYCIQRTEYLLMRGARGGAVVKALRYKPEGRGIDSAASVV